MRIKLICINIKSSRKYHFNFEKSIVYCELIAINQTFILAANVLKIACLAFGQPIV